MNHSNDTDDESLIDSCGIFHPSVITKISLVVAYVILFLAACLENSFVIYLVRTRKELKQSTFNYLIVNMAVADILDVVFATVASLSFLFARLQWIPGLIGNITCKLLHFLFVMSIGISISTLVIMSLDRYLAIVHTMRRSMTSSTAKRCIAASWVISAITASPYLYKMKTKKNNVGYICISEWSSDSQLNLFHSKVEECVKFALYYALPLMAIGLTNAIIGHTLRKRQPIGCSQTQAKINRQNKQIYLLLVTVVALFAFCWIFAHINHLLQAFHLRSAYCKLPSFIPLFFFWISHVNSAINPIIYFIFNEKFRRGLKEALRRKVNNDQRSRNVASQENPAFDDIDLRKSGCIEGERNKEYDTKL